MKKLELNQMENLNGGVKDCSNEAYGFVSGAIVGGTLSGGGFGFILGATVGLIGWWFILLAKTC